MNNLLPTIKTKDMEKEKWTTREYYIDLRKPIHRVFFWWFKKSIIREGKKLIK